MLVIDNVNKFSLFSGHPAQRSSAEHCTQSPWIRFFVEFHSTHSDRWKYHIDMICRWMNTIADICRRHFEFIFLNENHCILIPKHKMILYIIRRYYPLSVEFPSPESVVWSSWANKFVCDLRLIKRHMTSSCGRPSNNLSPINGLMIFVVKLCALIAALQLHVYP